MSRILAAFIVCLALPCLAQAGEPEFLNDMGKALDEAYERGAPIALIYLRSG